jgi:hypothetical protein
LSIQCADNVIFQALRELTKQLGADICEHAASELGNLPGDVKFSDNTDFRGITLGNELGGDRSVCIALPARVTTSGSQHGLVIRDVKVNKRCRALVLTRDRSDLYLDRSPVLITFDFVELCAGKAGRDPLKVGQNCPGRVDWCSDNELV